MLTRHAIIQRADADGVDAAVAERDYVLTHVVAQLHRLTLKGSAQLVFKGGTALRLVYIDQYRYSADLDFSVLGATADEGIASLVPVLAAAKEHAGLPHLEIVDSTPLTVAYVGPLGAIKKRGFKLDIAADEVVQTVERRSILPSSWGDVPTGPPFDVYSIDEIAAEKLRCVIQRLQCRDLYDIYSLTAGMGVQLAEVRPVFEAKARTKGIDPATFADRFEQRLPQYKDRWVSEISEHLPDPPDVDAVIRVVRRSLRQAGLLYRD
jgi:uncharacterized protein